MIQRLTHLAQHRARRVLLIAGLFLVIAGVVGGPVAGLLKAHPSDFQDPAAQSQRASALIREASLQNDELGVVALVRGGGDVRRDAAAQRKVTRVRTLLAAQPGFQRALDYPMTHSPQLVSRDGRETAVLAAYATMDQAAAAVAKLRPQLGSHGVRFGGREVAFHEINTRVSSDLEHAELLAFPLLLLLSFWVFRGLIAALLPPLVGAMAIVSTFLVLRGANELTGLSIFALNLVTGMGLGLAIDYSLFIVSRYREELAGEVTPREAIARTLASAGRTVLYSSLTVAGALASLLVFPLRFLYSMGIGGVVVALSAGAVSLIVLPALLLLLGERINSLAPAWLQRSRARAERATAAGPWFRLAHFVMRRPGIVAAVAAAALLAAALPSLRLALAPAGARVLPQASESRQVSDALARDYPSDGSQRLVVLARQPADPAALAARVAERAAGASVTPPRPLGHGVWEIDVFPRGDAISSANQQLVRSLRTLPVEVGGATAAFVDQKAAIAAHLPLALAILAIATFSVLFLMTGSVVLPLTALAMNVLTVGVAAGLLVLIFQDGHLQQLLGFRPIGGLEESNLVLLFIVAFALSTDYGVFLFGRIKEAHDAGLATRDAIALGLERTGRLVTAAALLFCVAVGAFATSHILFIKEFGVGTALAVAVDATLVRALLVPALMGMLRERNWWAPRELRRLHKRIGLSEGAAA